MSTSKMLILNLVLLAVVLESDLGRRKITLFRIMRPLLGIAAIVPFFLSSGATHGWGLALEISGTALGLGLGILAGALLPIRYDPTTRRTYSHGGAAYAALWVLITCGRLFFSYGSQHLFGHALGIFLATHRIGPGVLADAFIFLSLTMFLARTGSLLIRSLTIRGRKVRTASVTAPNQPAASPSTRSGGNA